MNTFNNLFFVLSALALLYIGFESFSYVSAWSLLELTLRLVLVVIVWGIINFIMHNFVPMLFNRLSGK